MKPASFSSIASADLRSSLLLDLYQEANLATSRSATVNYGMEAKVFNEALEVTDPIESETTQ